MSTMMQDIVMEYLQLRKDILDIADTLEKYNTIVLTVRKWGKYGGWLAAVAAIVCYLAIPFTAGASKVPAAYFGMTAGAGGISSGGASIIGMQKEKQKIREARSKLGALRRMIQTIERSDLDQSLRKKAISEWNNIRQRIDTVENTLSTIARSFGSAGAIPESSWNRQIMGAKLEVDGTDRYSYWEEFRTLVEEVDRVLREVY